MGLAYLGTAVKKAGFDVVALDSAAESPAREIEHNLLRFGLDENELRERIAAVKPDIVGIGCFFSSRFPAVLETARAVKEIDKRIITVTGGIHPSLMPGEVCSHPEIDFVVIGEGERIFVDLLNAISDGRDFDNIEGLAYKINGDIKITRRREYIEDLDSLGFPAWELFDMEKYLGIGEGRWDLGGGRYAPVVTSRSCPFRCTFCSIHHVMGPKYRAHSPDYVVDMIGTLVKKYDVDEISFEDDNLTYDNDRFVSICKGIVERGINIKWNTPNGVHVGSLDRNSIEWAKRSGCDSLNLAVESGDEFIRNKVIKKGLSSESIYAVAEACREMGIKTNAYFVIGMPGETEESINKSRKLLSDLRFNNVSIFVATPMPGTKLYDECIARGYLDKESYETDFVNYRAAIFTQPSIETPEFDRKKILLWQHRLYTAYFKATLRDRFFNWLTTGPRATVAMMIKILLYTLFGERLSYNFIQGIRKKIK
ncbi:MAG: cobalamin-dependent protein [Candidatus Zixiibacteriota bacterium]|nr:MAG: cobalamin-dependent protein [candidate division Zixibacteria bacterium]